MLQNQLKKQYSTEEINSYHLKASEWFDKNDFKEEAVKHALKGHKIELAADSFPAIGTSCWMPGKSIV